MTKNATTYNASAIQQLKGLEAVRKRPSMYLGDVSNGDALHKLIDEVVDNAVDEHLAGHCNKIIVKLLPDDVVSVEDDGRGIPVDLHQESGLSALELVMCNLHAGGKFGNTQVSAGLHGIGVAAINAVSTSCEVVVYRDGRAHLQDYRAGVPTQPVHLGRRSSLHGTKVTWLRDPTIFTGVLHYDGTRVANRLEELAFLNPGLLIHFIDERSARTYADAKYQFTGGLSEYLAKVIGKKRGLVPIMRFTETAGRVDIAMTWLDRDGEDIRCYANNTRNGDGGTHLIGFKNALTRLVAGYAKEHNMLRGLGEEGVIGADIREGLVAVLSIKMADLSFSSQTKDKLVTAAAKTAVEDLFNDQVRYWFAENPGVARKVAERAVLSAKAREAARKAREQVKRKEWMDPASLPGKLADCQSKHPDECEIFLVEGDSAGGSAKSARDRRFQAILPLRGKVLNVERVDVDTLLENKEIGTIVTALGCGIEQTGTFDIKKLRYHKIILMADADVDGAHIRTLLLTFLYRTMPRLVYGGYVYIAMPPLYGVRLSGAKSQVFCLDEGDFGTIYGSLTPEQQKALKVTRYKGLGEMNAEDLAVTTMDPAQRKLKQVTIQDAVRAERLFEVLMGDDVAQRKEFIEEHALSAKLDF